MVLVMINGQIVDPGEAKVSVWDRGYYFGDGVYEVIQAYAGKLWGFEPHFRRFERSLKEIGIEVELKQIETWVREAFTASGLDHGLVYWQVTRGCEIRSHAPGPKLEPQFFLYVKPAPDNGHRLRRGAAAITYPDLRWKRCDIKSLNLLPNVMAIEAAYKVGAEEALLVSDGVITEGASSCCFAVIDGKLITRPLGYETLPSVTRQAILAIAEKMGIGIAERSIRVSEAYAARELFTSSSGAEIRSVIKLDDRVISGGVPGPTTLRIGDEFIRHTRSGGSFDDLVKDTRFNLLP